MFSNLRQTKNRIFSGSSGGYEDLDRSSTSQPAPTTSHLIAALQSPVDGSRRFPPPSVIEDIGEMPSISVVPDETFTVTQAVDQFGFGRFQVRLSLFTGLCWMADSMEMTILSILSPALHCQWNLSRYQQALTTTVVFLGMMISSTFWGNLSDKYGRKVALTLCAWLVSSYGLISSFAPNFFWILFLRGCVGFAIGCVPQSVTLYAEFLPTKQRAKCVVLLDCFWALGACMEVLLALIVMPNLGWQWLLGLSSIPLFAFAFITPWLPESARFHVASGQADKALETLEKVAKENGKPMPLGRLVVDETTASLGSRGRVKDLLKPSLRVTSLLLWLIWSACAFCYYGLVLMSTELYEAAGCQNATVNININETACRELTAQDYIDLLWTTLAEFPGIFLTILVLDRFGRRRTMAIQFIVFSACLGFLFICTQNRMALTAILFLARGIIAGVFQAAYVYTPEVYPTTLRAVGVGTCSAMARFGAMITPYVAQVLMQTSISAATGVYTSMSLLAAVACYCLPIETKGRALSDTEF